MLLLLLSFFGVRMGVLGAPPLLPAPLVAEEGTGVRFLVVGRLALAMGVLIEA